MATISRFSTCAEVRSALDELEAEHVALLLALVEQSLVLRARRVVDAGEPAEQLLEGGEVAHVQHRLDLSG